MKIDSNGYLEKATVHNKRLPNLLDDLSKVKTQDNLTELKIDAVEVVRLCQLAILNDSQNGDAYVMLASAYFALSGGLRSTAMYYYCFPKGFMVITSWHERKHMRTKDYKLGLAFFQFTLNHVEELKSANPDLLELMKHEISEEMCFQACMPRFFEQFRTVIMASLADLPPYTSVK